MAGFFDTLFGGGAEKEAADKNRALYGDYLNKGTQFLDTGLANSTSALNQAKDAFTPLSQLGQKYGAGTDLYLDSLGVNGAVGNTNATSAFQAGPGYQFMLDQGLDALNRRRASAGMLNSGNADIDALNFGTGLANQTYTNWQNQLGGLVSPELQATSGAATGQAAALGSLSDLYQNDAINRIGLQGNFTSGSANANNLQAAGEAKGASNLLGLGMNLASLGMGGGATLGGNILKGAFG